MVWCDVVWFAVVLHGAIPLSYLKLNSSGLTPKEALITWAAYLTDQEVEELRALPPGLKVFYGGAMNTKPDVPFAIDDDHGHYILRVGDHIGYRYEILKSLNRGTFGIVVRAYDHKRHMQLAVKVSNSSAVAIEEIANEMNLLKKIQVAQLQARDHGGSDPMVVCPIGYGNSNHLFRGHTYYSMQEEGPDLSTVMYVQRRTFTGDEARDIAVSLLCGLRFLHNLNIGHFDIKPNNAVFVDPYGQGIKVKLIDLGRGQQLSSALEELKPSSTPFAHQWHCAPEIIIGAPYGLAADMFALACLLVEVMQLAPEARRPLFECDNWERALHMQINLLGLPTAQQLVKATRKDNFFQVAACGTVTYLGGGATMPTSGQSQLVEVLPHLASHLTPVQESFLMAILQFDPPSRLTAEQALGHSYCQGKGLTMPMATAAAVTRPASGLVLTSPLAVPMSLQTDEPPNHLTTCRSRCNDHLCCHFTYDDPTFDCPARRKKISSLIKSGNLISENIFSTKIFSSVTTQARWLYSIPK